ncbi:MAG: cation diffusion facilitator family transporter [Candidatus Aenigmarchaeota archaeon]|nr:cation diffusion facilitator family transporter [Candidatus Aenigmarchaeota archaeon]NIP40404.1 cation diffusion facilitator family transporter [Candidatus Aenigmarchaeota archaeon]NIQ18330.1 cation diffusion facilitator family transporter [Candidatus Aenigmarchaeota archaeon]NIS73282.1 cation diffusion facilitator family transporter [Candidatus Aenigmarchaeota archaeon]
MGTSERYRKARVCILVGIFGNLFLGIFKLFAGLIGNSFAVVADSVHSISDMLTSIVVWIGLKVGKKPPDKYHPYGHGDAEPIAGLIVSIVLCLIALEFVRSSIHKILTGEIQTPGTIALVAVIVSVLVKYWMAGFVNRTGKKLNSPALIADAAHHRSDFYTSLVVIVGVLGAMFGFRILDPIAGLIVALWIVKIGFDVGRRNIRSLMGEIPSEYMLKNISSIAMSVEGVKDVHNVRVHYVGPNASVSLHLNIEGRKRLSEVHDIASEVEEKIKKQIEPVRSVIVHCEPD